MLREKLEFNGTWRTYQARVLDRFYDYKRDGRVHIVAAPGSGKTTLGIELIRLFDSPCLILTPSITIRQQWVDRIEEAFLLKGYKSEDIITQNLKEMKLITVSTYQALHSAMNHYKGALQDEGDEDFVVQEDVDYEGFDVIQMMKENNIKTICLDECHHLRNEWWKSLEKFVKETSLQNTIALTATPPYDSTPDLWTRYMKLCGEIDEEISVPELVKDKNLCPHQDYVYFNYPTKEELSKIDEFKKVRNEYIKELLNDEEFKEIILSNKNLHQNNSYDELLSNPTYLSSILIYLNSQNYPIPSHLKELLGYTRLEKISPKWLEILLQGVLYNDCDSYQVDEETLKKYRNELKSKGLIEARKVTLQFKNSFKKELVRSIGKCESIKTITFNEYKSLNKELRLLILCDYIKKDYKSSIGDESKDVHALGVIPFFELLRRENNARNEQLMLGVLCGSVALIPTTACSRLLEIVECPKNISFDAIGSISKEDYVEIKVVGNRHFLTAAMTQLFEEGYMQVLIGTKSLLGEGWDSPCVNSLILASFVGSFMLSNQMRGRAIRTYYKKPNKTSNIWHLVCILPSRFEKDEKGSIEENQDMEMLERRMDNFLGLHYELDSVETGMARLSAIQYPIENKMNCQVTNKAMLRLSSQTDSLRDRWNKTVTMYEKMEITEQVEVKDRITTFVGFFDCIRASILFILGFIISFILLKVVAEISSTLAMLMYPIMLSCVLGAIFKIKKLTTLNNPLGRLMQFGKGVEKALQDNGHFEEYNHRVEVQQEGVYHALYLKGGSGHDKALFAQCVSELFDELDNQRYILYAPSRKNKMDGFYVVPELFSKRKEDAYYFKEAMKKYIGNYQLVYTRSSNGRKILLRGRKQALANMQNRVLRLKKVKSALE